MTLSRAGITKRLFRDSWRKMIIQGFAHHLRQKGDKETTVEWHVGILTTFKQWLLTTAVRNRPVTQEIILDYLDHRRSEGKSEATVAGDLRSLSAVFAWAHDNGHRSYNPCAGLKSLKAPAAEDDPFTPAEVAQILTYLNNNPCPLTLRDTALILFLYDTGCRITAMLDIKVADMNFDNRVVRVTDKYSKKRTLSWGDRTHQAILDAVVHRPKCDSEYLIVNQHGNRMTRSGIYQMFRKACNRSGVRFRKPHYLRSSYSCEFLMEGGPERAHQLQLILGHSDMTQINAVYGRTANAKLAQQAMRELSPGDRLPDLQLGFEGVV